MRSIDADELKEKISELIPKWNRETDYGAGRVNSYEFVIKIIDNAPTVEPQGDFISRSEAEKLGATCLARRNEDGQLEAIISLDLAPTVETYTKDDMTKEYLKGYNACKDMNERSQGEWIKNNYGEHHCNKCGHFALYEEYDDEFIENTSRFCPHCGSDMRGDNNGQ